MNMDELRLEVRGRLHSLSMHELGIFSDVVMMLQEEGGSVSDLLSILKKSIDDQMASEDLKVEENYKEVI